MKINCIMGQHYYRASDMEMYLAEKKPKSRVYRVIFKCYFCGKEKEELVEVPNPLDEVEDAEVLEVWSLDGSPTRYIKAKKDESTMGQVKQDEPVNEVKP